MGGRSHKLLIFIVLSCLVATGCVLRGPAGIQREIAEATGAEYDKEFAITLGRIGTTVARWVVDDDEDLPVSLKGVRKVQVGIYQVKAGTRDASHPPFEPGVLGDWNPIVAIRERDEEVHVRYKEKGGEIRSMLVLVSEPEELVIVRMKGRLDRVFREAMRYGLDEAGRGEYYEPALEQLNERLPAQGKV
jgi:hypothetical protein